MFFRGVENEIETKKLPQYNRNDHHFYCNEINILATSINYNAVCIDFVSKFSAIDE